MKRATLLIASGAASILIAGASFISVPERLIWNRTMSAPKGLYWLNDGPLTLNGWAVVSANAPDAQWAQQRGYVGPDWALIKRVRATEGDEICRSDLAITINGDKVADALEVDHSGRKLPVWSGCFTLEKHEYFLLNDHPRSLDGRYFGATRRSDIAGSAVLLWRRS